VGVRVTVNGTAFTGSNYSWNFGNGGRITSPAITVALISRVMLAAGRHPRREPDQARPGSNVSRSIMTPPGIRRGDSGSRRLHIVLECGWSRLAMWHRAAMPTRW